MWELDHSKSRRRTHVPKVVEQLALVGGFACMVPLNAQQAPDASDNRIELFVSADQPLRSGSWRYRVLEGGGNWWCKVMDAPSQTFSVVLENESDETLDCSISLSTSLATREEVHKNTVVVEPRGGQPVLTVCTSGEKFANATADCTIRPPPLPWEVPRGCTYSVVKAPPLEDFYPPSSRRRSEQGPVYVSFSMREHEGRPAEIKIAVSSGSERLDEAAMKYAKNITVRTSCPGVYYRMRLSFRLNQYGEPLEPGLATEAAGTAAH